MNESRFDLDLYARLKMAESGFGAADIEELLEPIARVAHQRRTNQLRLFWSCALIALVPMLNWGFDHTSILPVALVSLPLAILAIRGEHKWVNNQYNLTVNNLSRSFATPAVQPLHSVMADIANKRLLLCDGRSDKIDCRIGNNQIGVLLLSTNVETRRLVRLPGGGFIKGPFSVLDVSYVEATSLGTLEHEANDADGAHLTITRSTKPLALTNISPMAKPLAALAKVTTSLPVPQQANETGLQKRALSRLDKRRWLIDISDVELELGLETYCDEIGASGVSRAMRFLGVMSLRTAFLSNMDEDYNISKAIKKASDNLLNEFGRVRLSETRDQTGDISIGQSKKMGSSKPDSWLQRIAYGNDLKLIDHLRRAASQPLLPLDNKPNVRKIC